MTGQGARVDRRLERIEATCRELQRASATRLPDFIGDDQLVAATERRLQVAIQAAIDVGSHVISQQGWPTPADHRGVVIELGRHGVPPTELVDGLQRAAGLRNLLVHQLDDIDATLLLPLLGAAVLDLRSFTRCVLAMGLE